MTTETAEGGAALTALGLGVEVEDIISGISGIATSIHEHATGMIQFGVTPKAKITNGIVEDHKGAYMIDPNILRVIGRGFYDKVEMQQQPAAKLGQLIECETSGVQGIFVERVTFMNGCMYNWAQPRAQDDKKTEKPRAISIANILTKAVGEGVSAKVRDPRFLNDPAPSGRPPGGPTTIRPNICC